MSILEIAGVVAAIMVAVLLIFHTFADAPKLHDVTPIGHGQYRVKLRSRALLFIKVETHWCSSQDRLSGKTTWRHPRTRKEAPKLLSEYMTRELNRYLQQKPW